MLRKQMPHILLIIFGLIFSTISFLIPSRTIDVHIHDTYVVFDMVDAFRSIAVFFFLIFLVSALFRHRFYSKAISWLHVLLSISTLLAVVLLSYRAAEAYKPGFADWSFFKLNNDLIVITLAVFLLAQVLFVLNLLAGILKRTKV